MKAINVMLSNLDGKVIPIGYEGENMYTRVRINCVEIFTEYPDATVSMTISPPTGSMYPAVIEKSGVMVVWDITKSILSSNGSGSAQLTFKDGETEIKSVIFGLSINRSLIADGEPPEPVQEWIDQAEQTAEEIATRAAENVVENWDQMVSDVSALKSAFEQLNDNVITESAGPASIVSIADGADGMPMRKVEVTIEPVQDLHGYDAPWPAGGGKNKLKVTGTTQTVSGVTFTVNADGTITANGTASEAFSFIIWSKASDEGNTLLPTGTYIANGGADGGGTSTWRIMANGFPWGGGSLKSSSDSIQFEITGAEAQTNIIISVASGAVLNNVLFKPMIRLASESDATFAPYSNVCPISGWTGAKVTRTGVNIWDEDWENGVYTNGVKTNSIYYVRNKNLIPVRPNTTYYYKTPTNTGRVLFFDVDKAYISTSNAFGNATFTTPENCYYMAFFTSSTTYGNNVSINYPATDTDYHSYQGQTYEVTFPTEAGTVYGGTLDVVSGKLVVDRMEWTAPKTGWSLYKSGADSTIHYCNLPSETIDVIPNVIANRFYSISDTFAYYTKKPSWYSDMPDCHYVYNVSGVSGSKRVWIRYEGNDFEDVIEGAKFIFMLQTSQTYTLAPREIKTLLGINNVWADAGNTSITYPADTKMYIDNRINSTRKLIAGIETGFTASKAYAVGDMLIIGDDLYKVASSIASGATITVGTNVTKTTVAEQLLALMNA